MRELRLRTATVGTPRCARAEYHDAMLPAAAPPAPPGLDGFAERLGPGTAQLRSVRELHGWLLSLTPDAPLTARVAALQAGARWLTASGPIPVGDPRWYDEAAPT